MKIQHLIEDSQTQRLIRRIQSVLSPELLKPHYRRQTEADPNLHCTFGHCYAAAEALWHALGGMESDWRPVVAKDDEGGTHWWLENIQTGEIADPTAEQYQEEGEEPPYDRGRRAGFLTKKPSKRAKIILDRI